MGAMGGDRHEGGRAVGGSQADFVTQCIHVGNVGGVTGVATDDERALVRRYEPFGAVLAAVIRYREPTPDHPNNNWAMLAFATPTTPKALVSAGSGGKVTLPAKPGSHDLPTVRRQSSLPRSPLVRACPTHGTLLCSLAGARRVANQSLQSPELDRRIRWDLPPAP